MACRGDLVATADIELNVVVWNLKNQQVNSINLFSIISAFFELFVERSEIFLFFYINQNIDPIILMKKFKKF
jgi:hypothetical protein